MLYHPYILPTYIPQPYIPPQTSAPVSAPASATATATAPVSAPATAPEPVIITDAVIDTILLKPTDVAPDTSVSWHLQDIDNFLYTISETIHINGDNLSITKKRTHHTMRETPSQLTITDGIEDISDDDDICSDEKTIKDETIKDKPVHHRHKKIIKSHKNSVLCLNGITCIKPNCDYAHDARNLHICPNGYKCNNLNCHYIIHTETSLCKVLSTPNWKFGLCRDFYYNNGQCMTSNCKRLHFTRHIPKSMFYHATFLSM